MFPRKQYTAEISINNTQNHPYIIRINVNFQNTGKISGNFQWVKPLDFRESVWNLLDLNMIDQNSSRLELNQTSDHQRKRSPLIKVQHRTERRLPLRPAGGANVPASAPGSSRRTNSVTSFNFYRSSHLYKRRFCAKHKIKAQQLLKLKINVKMKVKTAH